MVHRYAVANSAPRPESYLTGTCPLWIYLPALFNPTLDYLTANGPDVKAPLNENQKADLYAELASGAESGTFLQVVGTR